jgi:hypothetical protein
MLPVDLCPTFSREVTLSANRIDVHVAVCAAAGRLGDVVGGALSDRTVWAAASSPGSSAQRDVVRVSEEDAHRSRLPFVPGVYRPFWRDFVSHARRARRVVQPHGAVASSRALGGFCTGTHNRFFHRLGVPTAVTRLEREPD